MLKRFALACTLSLMLTASIGCANNTLNDASATAHNHSSAGNKENSDQAAENTAPVSNSTYMLDASVSKEANGFYLKVSTNYKLTNENYGGSPIEGEGHIHYYLNGKLVGPLTSEDPYQLVNLEEGMNTIKLDLANHDHSTLGISKELSFENK